jgi:hypothetical protein
VVQSKLEGEAVYPFAIYLDGVPFQKRDGLLCFTAYNLITLERHLVVLLRKSEMCKCGCTGWCTLFPVWLFLADAVAALAAGVSSTGERLQKMCLLHIKGDWAEFAHSIGLPSWSSLLHPCFACIATKDQLLALGDASPVSGPYPDVTQLMYEDACEECEVWVQIETKLELALLVGRLFFDNERGGSKGRAVRRPGLPEFGLRAGDRLEPTRSLADVSLLEYIAVFPCWVLFWRPGSQTVALHRNPIFGPGTHTTTRRLALDTLHCLNLGVYKAYCMTVLWRLILSNVWQVHCNTQDVLIQLSVLRMKQELFAWYKQEKKTTGARHIQELQDLTTRMLGTAGKHSLATKAAETGTLIKFCVDMVKRNILTLGPTAQALDQVGEALLRLQTTMRENDRAMSPRAVQILVDAAKRAFLLREQAGITWTPKWHMMIHLVCRAGISGNPTYHATFVDEGWNGRLAACAGKCHRMTWHRRVMASFRWLASAAGLCRSRRRRLA